MCTAHGEGYTLMKRQCYVIRKQQFDFQGDSGDFGIGINCFYLKYTGASIFIFDINIILLLFK